MACCMPLRCSHAVGTVLTPRLGICRFSEPLAFNSILAYSYVMVQDLGISENNASFCSGLLVSAYAVAEAITALGWGAISDVYGRKPVALFGLLGVAMSSIAFGMAQNFWQALLARFIGGALNGNVAIMQTMVAEMVKNPAHEPRAYATQPFVWTIGGIIGSAMGGFLAQPANFFPNTFSQDGIFGRFPYLLPNLVAAVGIFAAIIQGMFFLEETNPRGKEEYQSIPADDHVDERTPLSRRPRERVSISGIRSVRGRSMSIAESYRQIRKRASFMEEGLPLPVEQRFDIRRSSFGTMHSIRVHNVETLPLRGPAPPPEKTFNARVLLITAALTLIAFHQMAYITTLPIYILDKPDKAGLDFVGGLGKTLPDVGTYLSVNGFISLFIQGIIFPIFVENIGVWWSICSMIVLYPITYLVTPFVGALPPHLLSAGIYFDLTLQAIFGIISIPCLLILLKNATPSPLVLGRVNGLAMSACCLARTVSPPLVGVIYSWGGSGAAWFTLAAAAVVGAIQLYWLPRDQIESVEIESVLKHSVHDDVHEEAIVD
ncbi:major facilitator superfamily domain-containing protein [Massariosphaeria phaeospora]|uniref:Major facilitator superfamily domain-containing protein n=1 Tax=Massariosphaeria phaeospora TaxID=100035 RepID=A0A7C8ME93_9PLEO|nr:major facilitator superfamily domain-containing protein [Massariosphaeria phaeospora]